MLRGRHGQRNIDYMNALGRLENIGYKFEHTFSNGVRTGYVALHDLVSKRGGVGQSWFPASWTKIDIDNAGKYVIQNNLAIFNSQADGVPVFDIYNGVRVGVMKTEGKLATIFPDNKYQPNSSGVLILNPRF